MTESEINGYGLLIVGALLLVGVAIQLFLRHRRGMVQVEGTVGGTEPPRSEFFQTRPYGFHDLINFSYQGRIHQIRDITARTDPRPFGSRVTLYFPVGKPDDAQPNQTIGYSLAVLLGAGAVWLGGRILGLF